MRAEQRAVGRALSGLLLGAVAGALATLILPREAADPDHGRRGLTHGARR
ncbi:hypothetical protein BH20ACT9_BH20ACT9_03980 [soil metagenome]